MRTDIFNSGYLFLVRLTGSLLRKLKASFNKNLIFGIFIFALFPVQEVVAQSCSAGTAAATFAWGGGNSWPANSTSNNYIINYTDEFGQPNTVDVTVNLIDPNNRNLDSNLANPHPFGDTAGSCGGPLYTAPPQEFPSTGSIQDPWDSDCYLSTNYTQSNGLFGSQYLTFIMKSFDHTEEVTFQYVFSKPVFLDDMELTDVDYAGFNNDVTNTTLEIREIPGNSFQDELSFSATDSGGSNVSLSVVGGSSITVSGQSAKATYNTNLNGNISPTNPAGFVNVSSPSELTTFNVVYSNGPEDAAAEQGNPGAYSYWSAANGATNGASDGHAITVGGFLLCVSEPPPELAITKTSSANGGPVSPGDTITYTIEVENISAADTTNVVVTDTLPTGVTYVASSAQKTYQAGGTGSFTQNMGSGSFETTGLTQSFNVTSANVPSGATLNTYGFTVTGSSSDWLSDITLSATYPGGTAFNLGGGSFGGNGSGSFNETRGPSSFAGSAEGLYSFIWDDGFNGAPGNDNSVSSASFTITYGTARAATTDAAGAPPNLVTAIEGIDLLAGEIMTITFDVTVDNPLNPLITQLTNTAATTSSETPTPVTDTAIDTVLLSLGSIGDTVFEDANGNGSYDVGEGIAGVDVTLTGTDTNGSPVSTTVTTAGDGQYLFPDLVASDASGYTVTVDEADLSVSLQGNNTVDPDGGNDSTSNVVLAAGADDLAQDFGYEAPLGSIGDTVFEDANGNGSYDVGEGIAGVDVTLTGTDVDGNVINTTVVTAGDGQYLFPTLIASDASGYTVTVDEADLSVSLQSNNTVDPDGGNDSTSNVVLAAGVDNLAQDFGYEAPLGSIGDTVFEDANGNGSYDVGEGIAGVDVTLTGTDVNGSPVSTTVTTAGDGQYLFATLIASDASGYTVTVDEADLSVSLQGNNTVDPDGGNDSTSNVVLAAGADDLAQDFGYEAPLGSIGDTVFEDTNGNGSYDVGEGIAGVDVTLTGSDVNGSPVSTTVTTAGDGQYLFPTLLASDASGYTVTVDEADLSVSLQGNNTVDPDGGNDSTSNVVLAAGADDLDQDFGYEAPLGSIGDTVFEDTNGNGAFDVGEGIAGVDVTLTGTDVDGNVINTTVVTAGDGQYLFPTLIASDASGYTVTVDETDLSVSLQGNNSVDPDGGNDSTSNVVLAAGANDLDQDFGYEAPLGSIGDTVFEDANGNGSYDVGEGIAGVDVTLTGTDVDGNVINTTVVTAGDGQYLFPTLIASDASGYTVTVDEADLSVSLQGNNTVDPDGGNDSTSNVVLAAGVDNLAQDFGYEAPLGSIGDTVFEDTNGNGSYDVGEGIAGVDVTLTGTDVNGSPVSTTVTTAGDGQYLFPTLIASDASGYTVTVDEADLSVSLQGNNTVDPDGGNDSTSNVVLAAGADDLAQDFGYEAPLGSIGDTVFEDANGNGSYDVGEGIAGVDVTLTGTDVDGNVINTTVVTAGDGQYVFPTLIASDASGYTVTVDEADLSVSLQGNNTVDPDGGNDSTSNVVLAAGVDNLAQDFGYEAPLGSIGDTVFEDANGNGAFDVGEGIAGVDVTLTGTDVDGNVINTTVVTAGDGQYLFPTLIASDASGYTVTVDETDLSVSLQGNNTVDPDGGNDSTSNVVLAAGADDLAQDFGYQALGSVGDTVFEDANGNGSYDVGEGIAGVDVTLTGTDVNGNVINTTVTTAGDGQYLFTDMPQSDVSGYTVTVDEADLSVSLQGHNTVDPDGGNDSTSNVVLAAGVDNLAQDFGYQALSSVGDTVFNDANGDGVQGATEIGINGVTVRLLDNAGNILQITTTTSNPTTGDPGYYVFGGLQPGDYEIEFVTPTGFIFSPINQTTEDLDSDANLLTGRTGVFTLAAGEDNADVDAGMVPGGSIGDHIWLDTDGDGVDDIGEQGIAGVTVGLTGTAADGTAITLTTITDANGDYLFDNLPSGNYTVTVTDTNGQLTDLSQSPGNTGSESVTLIADQVFLDADFGYVPIADTAVIGDTVWADTDSDGIQDPGEVGIDGVTLNLVDGSGSVVNTVTTDADGTYLFTDVPSGDYTVVVTDTGGVLTDPVTNVTSGPQSPGSLTSSPITVLPDDVYIDADFGFSEPGLLSLADRVWYDADGDSVQDVSEYGIAGVTLDLLDSSGNIVASVITNENGDFQFDGLTADQDYTMVITDDSNVLTGYFPTTPPADALILGVTVNQTNDAADGTNDEIVSGVNFGFNQPGMIGDMVWNDANGDGVQDPGEGSLAGVTLTLTGTDVVGNAVNMTATTDSNGEYLFANVPAGANYAVTIDANNFSSGGALDGYTQTYDADDGTAANDNQSSLPLVDGESNLNQDFGYQNTTLPNISGTVFYDVDTDGTHEPAGNDTILFTADDETGISGVSLDLIDNNDIVTATTTTDANGDYSFPNVPPADYTVAVTDTNSVLDGYELTSGLDVLPVTQAQLNVGDVTDVDFGYVDDEQTAAITSGLWIDSDGDGVRDPGEIPIANVDIDLIGCGPDAICGTADDAVVGTATTDIDSNVIFPDLPPGVYALDSDEADSDFPSDITEISNYSANYNNPNDPIFLSEGETYDADFGYIPDSGTAGLSGTLWNDSNADGSDGDGIQDASEVGLGGIFVSLTNVNSGSVNVITTAPDGSYTFTGLSPCPTTTDPCYMVTYAEPNVTALGLSGVEPTNTPDQNALDGSSTPDGLNDNIYLVNLQDGEFKDDYDFGFDAPANLFGAIDGFVYYEPAPANGDRDAGIDAGIESVTLNLLDAGGDVIATTTTSDGHTDVNGDGVIDPTGYYSFTNLMPGDYTVVVTDTNNATLGFNPAENPTGTSPTLTVPAGGLASADFGYIGEQGLGNIGNLIWFDVGGTIGTGGSSDGIFDPLQGDVGLAGVRVECWADSDGNGQLVIDGVDNLIRTVTTDENGEYYCEGIPTGDYFIRVTDENEMLAGFTNATVVGGATGALTDTDNTNKMAILDATGEPDHTLSGPVGIAWAIQTGSDNLTGDFAVTGTNSISGLVFEESAGLVEPDDDGVSEATELDGIYDSGEDTLINAVTVILLREQPDGSFVELTRTTTLTDGTYAFTGLPNGNYQVVTDTDGSSINGYGQTADPDLTAFFPGGSDAAREAKVCDSPTKSLCDNTAGGSGSPLSLTGGTVITGVDFGYQNDFITTPITLGYFHAQSLGGGTVEISWQTVTEVAHLGFNLYVREIVDGAKTQGWRRLNTDMIAPAAAGDSFDVREYSFTANDVTGKRFALGDVAVTGKETLHGPFKLDRESGANRSARTVTDWSSIKAKHNAKQAARGVNRKARAQMRLHKALHKSGVKVKRAAKQSKSTQQTDKQKDQEFEMLELDNERCELERCYGDEVGLFDADDKPSTESGQTSLASRLVAGLFALIVPSAYALEPVSEVGVIQIETTEAGIYRVTYDDVLEQGIDIADVLHEQLSLTNNNEPVYIRTWGQDSRFGNRRYFGPGGGFEFVAEERRTLYSKSNVYSLHVNAPKGFRKPIRPNKAVLPSSGSVVDYYQETTVLEPEIAYSTLSPNGDPWFGFQATSSGADKTISIPYRVDNLASGHGIVETQLQAWGMTTGSHQVSITSNGQLIDEQTFSGITAVTLSGELLGASLQDGVNIYSLTIPGRGVIDQLALDKWSVTYPRWTVAKESKALEFEAVGDIISVSGLKNKWVRIIREDAGGVMTWIPYSRMKRVKQSDKSYTINFPGSEETATYYVSVITDADRRVARLSLSVVQDDLTTGSADYLIVSHPDFIDGNMARFVAAKQAQGFSVKVADVEAVYTRFGAGQFGSAAIRDYIDWAHDNLGTQMVLLVGDDMFDYHGNQYTDAISFIPSIYTATSSLVNIAPVDAKYVDFNNDDIPDIQIGRLNPKLSEEWASMVDKTLSYGQHPNPQSIVFSADGFDAAQGYDFSADADNMVSRLPVSWQSGVSKYYIDELGAAGARTGLLSALNAGPAVTAFVGHSGPRDWSFSGLLRASDAANLTNNGAPTVVTQWGCWNTYYATPNGSMANEFLRNPGGGAVAVLGAIALTEAAHEQALALEVFERMFQPGMSIGDAVLQAKQAYAAVNPVSTHKDVILGWTLMADPALVIQQ